MIDPTIAQEFAQHWLSAWNSHDLEAILSHYSEDIEMISPYIVLITGEPSGTLRGKKAVGDYWATALAKYPQLHFELRQILIGVQSVVIYYQGIKGIAAETFVFNHEGKV